MDAEPPPPRILLEPDAAAFIRKRGGRLFIWLDAHGMQHVALDTPGVPVEWNRYEADVIEVVVDQAIAPPPEWRIALRRFPRRRVEATWSRRGTSWFDAVTTAPLP